MSEADRGPQANKMTIAPIVPDQASGRKNSGRRRDRGEAKAFMSAKYSVREKTAPLSGSVS
jgi:hypothetical protein